jgi:hypothetical protein
VITHMRTRNAMKFFSSPALRRIFLMKDNRPEQIAFVVYALVGLLALANIAYTFLFSKVMVYELSTRWGEILFTANILAAHTAALYLLFRFIKQISKSFTARYIANATSSYTQTYFKKMYSTLVLAEFTIIGIFLAIIFQIAFSSSYHIGLLIPIMAISFILATVIMSLLSYRLFQWYRITRNLPLLLYTSIAFLAAGGIAAMTVSNFAIIFLQQEHIAEVITPATQLRPSLQPSFLPERSSSSISSSSSTPTLYDLRSLQVVVTPLRIVYVFLWFTSVLFLRHYSKRVGEVRFWIIIALPLLSFLVGVYLLSVVDSYSSSLDSQQEEEEEQQSNPTLLLYILLVVASVIAGAILFGMMFLSVAKSMHKIKSTATSALANYLTVSAYGIIILPESLTSPFIDLTAYPPFSAIAWSLGAFACYLFSFGFYASAISLSYNRDLRRAIRNSALEQSSKLLDNMGVGELQQQLQDKVMNIVNAQAEKIEHQTGIQSSFSEEEAKEYLQQVLNEIKAKKSKS